MNNTFFTRNLYADEIYVKKDKASKDGLKILLYKDSRADMRILTETFGENWSLKLHHVPAQDRIISEAEISATLPDGRFVTRMGSSDSLQELGGVKAVDSDAIKRAGFAFGIGQELYSISCFIPANELFNLEQKGDGSWEDRYDGIRVSDVQTSDTKVIQSITFRIYSGAKEHVYTLYAPKNKADVAPITKPLAKPLAKAKAEKPEQEAKTDTADVVPDVTDFTADPAAPMPVKAEAYVPEPEQELMAEDDQFLFGKYKGKTLGEAKKDAEFSKICALALKKFGTTYDNPANYRKDYPDMCRQIAYMTMYARKAEARKEAVI